MSKYTPISETEMDAVFQPAKGWTKIATQNGHGEFVYQYRTKFNPAFVVKVYSSVSASRQVSRKVGLDAIRVCAVNTVTDRGLIKSARIHRTAGWEVRVRERVLSTLTALKARRA